jgi:hypothetical protein
MGFPVPPDARLEGNFSVVRGTQEMIRENLPLFDETEPVDQGEWMKRVPDAGVSKAGKLADGVDTLAAPALGAKVSWTSYRENDTNVGQSDALATKSVDLLSGSYQAKTKLYNTGAGGLLIPGNLVVARWDATQAGGILDVLNPATADVRQLQAVVGRIVEVNAGVMHYEAPGL